MLVLVSSMAVNAQSFDDYILETRGDTVVVKDLTDMAGVADALFNAIELDNNAPAGRVYEMKRGGLYWVTKDLVTPADRAITIAGAGNIPMATGDDPLGPPILSGTTDEGGEANNGDIIQFQNDVTLKNGIFMPAATDGSIGWTFLSASAEGTTVTLDNVLMEHTLWVFIQSNDHPGTTLDIQNSYFVNLSGLETRRNGGVFDNVSYNTYSVKVENTTHVMASGIMYKFRNYPINEIFINHNTFVNASGQIFATFGYHSNWSMTNNLFVNSNVQAYAPGLDYGETDQGSLPMGIVNINTIRDGDGNFNIDSTWVRTYYPDITVEEFGSKQRKVLVDKNGIYWDPRLDQIVQTLNDNNVKCPTDDGCLNESVTWETQMITMNSRTQAMFDDNDTYPYLVEGSWIMEGDPSFTADNGLMTNMVDSLIKWSVSAIPTDNIYTMHVWRADGNEATPENFTFSDWPVNADLSYTNPAYLNGGMGGFPLGDLNWFPAEKASWLAQRDAEHATIKNALETGTPVSVEDGAFGSDLPSIMELNQNYPNPFNPSTNIQFKLNKGANISLTVYDAIGKKVATLINNQFTTAGVHNIQFNAANLSSGIYYYKLNAGDVVQTKAMMLIK